MVAQDVDVQALVARLEALEKRVKELEAGPRSAAEAGKSPVPAAETPMAAISVPSEISEEHLAVISAAVASFLGVKAHIKQIRLVGNEAWAQQGRVSIMASHRWAMHRQ